MYIYMCVYIYVHIYVCVYIYICIFQGHIIFVTLPFRDTRILSLLWWPYFVEKWEILCVW